MYQLWLRDQTFASLVDRIVGRACAIVPSLDVDACRRLVELMFHARVRQTEACGRHPECRPHEAMWPPAPAPGGATCAWLDPDPQALPAMFAAAAADLARPDAAARHDIERRLAAELRSVLADLLFCNPRCGRAAACDAAPVFPLAPLQSARR